MVLHFFLQTCSLECEGGLDSQKLRSCQDFLLEEDNHIRLNADPRQQQDLVAMVTTTTNNQDVTSAEHQLAKKYGGFMKRYGGFMSRRSSSTEEALNDPGNQEEDNIHLEILKILKAAANQDSESGHQEGDEVKRYGGFMRRAEADVMKGDLLEAVFGRGLKKRYGGFMRRVGRPEWLVENSKSAGVFKRAWENGNELRKRYGGFMD